MLYNGGGAQNGRDKLLTSKHGRDQDHNNSTYMSNKMIKISFFSTYI